MGQKLEIELLELESGRIIISCNGFEIDILADDDGIVATLQGKTEILAEFGVDFKTNNVFNINNKRG